MASRASTTYAAIDLATVPAETVAAAAAGAGRPVSPHAVECDEVLSDLFRARGILSRRSSCQGVSRQQVTLGMLYRYELGGAGRADWPPITQTFLAQALGVTAQSMGEQLAKMQAAGLIERTQSPRDSRAMELQLTDEGRVQAREVIATQCELAEQVLSCLEPQELADLGRLLRKVNDSL